MPDLIDSLKKALAPLRSGWGTGKRENVVGEGEGGGTGLVCKMKSKFF